MAQMTYTIQAKRDTAANWTANNPTLAEGEFGFETDTKKLKIGDGNTLWASLPYKILTDDIIGVANGVAPLNVSGTIDPEYVDAVATMDTVAYPTALKIGDPTHIDTMQELFNHQFSAGVMHGCDITDNGDGTVSFASGYAMLRATADDHSPIYAIAVSAQSDLTLFDNAANWVYLDYNSGTPQFVVSTSRTAFNCLDKCLAYLIYRSGTDLNIIDAREQNVDGNRKSRRLFLDFSRFIHAAGGSALSNPSTTTVAVTAGSFYFMLLNLPHDAFDTSVAGTDYTNVFTLWYRNGSGGWTKTLNQKTISTTTYDNNTGTPVVLNNNKYGVTWFYIVHDSPSHLHAVMGQVEYPDEASARAATPPSSIPGVAAETGSIIGSVVYLKSAVTFAAVLSAFSQAYASSAATSHNALSGLQGGTVGEFYHLTNSEYAGTGTGTFVRETSPTVAGNIGLDKASKFYVDSSGVKTFGWRDNITAFVLKGSGLNNPSWALFRNGIYGYFFFPLVMTEVWATFHIDHDYALGTAVYPHIHWSPNTTSTGVVRWGIEYTVAKGHQQGATSTFGATTTVYVEQTVSTNSQYQHFIAETSLADAIPSTNLEPDSVILIRFFRDSAHANDTFPDAVMGMFGGIHYQTSTISTLNKAPNFYA